MTWEAAAAILAALSLGAKGLFYLAKIREELVETRTRLAAVVDAWTRSRDECLTDRKAIHSILEVHGQRLDNHEYRISTLEGDE